MSFDHGQHFHIDQRRENDGALTFDLGRVVNLAYRLVGFVHAVDEGQPDMAGFDLKLGQDSVTKCLSGDAGAVRDEKYGAMGHVSCPVQGYDGSRWPRPLQSLIIQFLTPCTATTPSKNNKVGCRTW